MEVHSSQALLGNEAHDHGVDEDPAVESHNLQGAKRLCGGTGCGFSDARNQAADSHARSVAARKLGLAMVLCLVFVAVEVAGGVISNSLAILTDAAHLLSDVAGFAISLFAIWASSWEATPRQSYGYLRLEILGALLSIQLIWLLTGIIVYEAINRCLSGSQSIDGRLMFIVASFGLCVNIIMVFLLGHHGHSHGDNHTHGHGHDHRHGHVQQGHKHIAEHSTDSDHDHNHDQGHDDRDHDNAQDHDHDHNHDHSHYHVHDHSQIGNLSTGAVEELRYNYREFGRKESFNLDIDIDLEDASRVENIDAGNINVRGAWLHVFGDLIQSVGVMIGGGVIWARPQWTVVDLICTLLFSLLVLGTTIKMLRDIMEILMESTPREIDVKRLENGLCNVPGVIAVHDLHIWAITMGKTLLACHVTVVSDADADVILEKILGYCEQVFNISHVTVQVERQGRIV